MKRVYKPFRIIATFILLVSLYYTVFAGERAVVFPGTEEGWLNEQSSSFYTIINIGSDTPFVVVLEGPEESDFDLCILEHGVRTTPCSNTVSSIESLSSIWNDSISIEVDAWDGSGAYTLSTYRDCVQLSALFSSADEEWVEIQNVCIEEKNISGYRISDENATYVIGNRSLLGREFLRFDESIYNPSGSPFGLSLSNAASIVTLVNPDGRTVDSCEYPEALQESTKRNAVDCSFRNSTIGISGEINRLTFSN